MAKRGGAIRILHVINHEWNVVKRDNDIVLLKCTCCHQPRIGVAKQREIQRDYDGTRVTFTDNMFFYHGYDYDYAEQLYNELIKRYNNDNYEDENEDDNNNDNSTTNNKRNNNNGKKDDKTNFVNTFLVTNPYFHIRGEKKK